MKYLFPAAIFYLLALLAATFLDLVPTEGPAHETIASISKLVGAFIALTMFYMIFDLFRGDQPKSAKAVWLLLFIVGSIVTTACYYWIIYRERQIDTYSPNSEH